MISNKPTKIISILGFIFLTIAILIAWKSPASGYESSIYLSTPILFWICLVFSMITGIFIIIYHVNKRQNATNYWIIGFILIFLINIVILSLHIIRGYAILDASGDTGTHLGIIKEIIAYGHSDSQNIYPIVHIYIAQFSLIINLDFILSQKFIIPLFAIISMSFLYFLAQTIITNQKAAILISTTGLATVDIQALYLTPNALGNLILPFIIYIIFKVFTDNRLTWNILLILLIIFIAPLHPVPTIVLIIMIITMWVVIKLFFRLKSSINILNFNPKLSLIFTFSLLIVIWSIFWISSFSEFEGTTRSLRNLILGHVYSQIVSLDQQANSAIDAGYSLMQQFLRVYGIDALFIVFSIIAAIIIKKQINSKPELIKIAVFLGPLLLLCIFMIIVLLSNLPFGGLRFLYYIKLISSVFVGFVLYELIAVFTTKDVWIKIFISVIIGIFLSGVFIANIIALYPSPYTRSPSLQDTFAELDGSYWFILNKNTSLIQTSWYFETYRFAAFQLSPKEFQNRNDILAGTTIPLPNHLGYDKYSTIGEYYPKDIYLIISEKLKRTFIDTYPEMAKTRADVNDFSRMENDISLDKLYDNNGFNVWYIHSQKNSAIMGMNK